MVILVDIIEPVEEFVTGEEEVVEWEDARQSADHPLNEHIVRLMRLVESIQDQVVTVSLKVCESAVARVVHGIALVSVINTHQKFGILTSINVAIIV